ncbi:enoyl-CoA hydratase-related protein [Arsenicicoccus piscis]|uniref:Enoyl-CoA hydratase n=1 Tax=Arsenicicoccus piscis TaxID=673954 RepID=A0ABQ6HPT4_9MICO|nr:enoyl-CoA hydratase-related protein [Arsenicicoccus piscis]MCH8629089.1 enoyl-CoA hydratase-related protein [Arsenicicoccus piscis]GMA20356.1 enoyl-CoA hydratase [Arsenicicoccus piscis]
MATTPADLPVYDHVTLTRHGDDGHVLEIALDRPEAMNAVSTALARDLGAATRWTAADPHTRAVLLTSTHAKAFCVGADLKERNSLTDAQIFAQRPITRAAYNGVLDLPQPTIAAVDGFALGGGFELALSCDIIVCGDGATVGLPEVAVGVIPAGGGTQLLVRRVGWGRASSMIFTAARLSAADALTLGAVERVVPAGEARTAALELATVIAANSPVGVVNAKKAMRLGSDVDLAAGLEVEDGCWRATAFSPDRAEGVAAFAEKRRPRWPGPTEV